MADDPYASHLHVLRRLGAGVRNVLELGSGIYSTPLFLDRSVFPDLHSLHVVEPDMAWAVRMPKDDRLFYNSNADVQDYDLDDFDLIFVDSGPEERRISDITHIAGVFAPSITRVVIHDFEHEPYQQAAKFDHIEIDKTLTPWTAVCWND